MAINSSVNVWFEAGWGNKYNFPNVDNDTVVLEDATQTLTNKSVNWVTLVTWWTSTNYLSEDGTYTAPAWWGSPWGSDTQIQYNDSWSFAWATNVKIENDWLRLDHTTTPTTPSAWWHILFNRSVAWRQMPAFMWPSWLDSVLQPLLARNKIWRWNPPWNLTTASIVWLWNITITGFTATSRAVATTNLFTRMRRVGYVTAAIAWTVWQWRINAYQYTVWDSTSWLGGFTYIIRFGISDAAAVSDARMFLWMRSSSTPANVEPSTLTNCIWVWHWAADTNLKIFYWGSSAQTPIDLWANFPITHWSVNAYELALFSSPMSWDVSYQVTRLNTWDIATWTITNSGSTVLPTNTTLLAMRWYRTNNATALAVWLDVMSAYIETDY